MKKKIPYGKGKRKYGNKKVSIDGHTFDSKAEAAFYNHLNLQKKAGEVTSFEMQPKYILLEKFKHPGTGKTVRSITYKPDFIVTYANGYKQVIDVKGYETRDFKLRAKLFMQRYQLPLVLVKYDGRNGSFKYNYF